ncbi:MAG: DUF134 domain-containing protein [Halanaerobiales bacterium]
MPRPPKKRNIKNIPEIKFFKPAGIPMRNLSEVNLRMEEVEAIRLKDIKELTQQECSEKMNVSRPTFQRILTSARKKIAKALLKGKAIRFKGGDYKLVSGKYKCSNCGEIINISSSSPYSGSGRGGRGRGPGWRNRHSCPNCEQFSLQYIENEDSNKARE